MVSKHFFDNFSGFEEKRRGECSNEGTAKEKNKTVNPLCNFN